MLTVICGEDSVASRTYLQHLKQNYTQKGYNVTSITTSELEDVYKNSSGVMGLFGQQNVYVIEKLSAALSRKKKSADQEMIKSLIENKEILLIDWEDRKSAYELTSLKKIATDFKEFKPEKTIFQLLDSFLPKNMKSFLHAVEIVNKTQEDSFIFAMLSKHVRQLILAKENALDSKMSPWQKMNITKQANVWDTQKLIGFYDGLSRVDIAMKTSNTPFSLKKSLDILACYYL
jgi:DNA polymerase III delta subunit